jgi:hypothetical protein
MYTFAHGDFRHFHKAYRGLFRPGEVGLLVVYCGHIIMLNGDLLEELGRA